MKPLISIILPIYNVEKYLKQCLISIQNQSYPYFEVICINDGSIDQCEKIFYDTVSHDKRFTLYSQKNKGIATVRNLGLALAKGELISFVDSDDTIQSNYLEVLVKGILEHHCDIAVGGHTVYFPKFHYSIHFPFEKVLSNKIALTFLISDTFIMNYSWGKCYKKEVWKNITFPKNKTYEDVETICQTFMQAKNVYVSNQSLYNYMIRLGSISQQKGRNKELKRAYITQMHHVEKEYPHLKLFSFMNCMKADILDFIDTITKKP